MFLHGITLGSTAGGIKLARVCILMKNLVRNIRKKMVPDRTVLLESIDMMAAILRF